MFDTKKVASNIKAARTKMNMTQMNLADEMGVSYQAVSNWERGNSMPDISKLPELCKILNISFEELVGERTAETEIAEKLMQDENADVSLEEVAQVGQLVKPERIERKINETVDKGEQIAFEVLVGLAPFMDSDTLSEMAEKIADIDLKKLCKIVPFIESETLNKIIDKCIQNENVDADSVIPLAPFLSRTAIQKLADYLVKHGQANKLVELAPFMNRETLNKIVDSCIQSEDKDVSNLVAMAPFLSKVAIQKIAAYLVEHNQSEKLVELAPFMSREMFTSLRTGVWKTSDDSASSVDAEMDGIELDDIEIDDLDEEEVARIAFAAFKQGKDVAEYLAYMDDEDIARLAMKVFEAGGNTKVFLAYMDEEDVERLAIRAFEKGEDIACYLDYMDEDAVKRLLLKAIRK